MPNLCSTVVSLAFAILTCSGFCKGKLYSEFYIVSSQIGDHSCYLEVKTADSTIITLPAAFDVCGKKFHDKWVLATWDKVKVLHPSCAGNMDCKLSIFQDLVVSLSLRKKASKSK